MTTKNSQPMKADKLSLLALFLTIFVDAAGMALVYPVLTPIFANNTITRCDFILSGLSFQRNLLWQ